ncbi:MAG: GldG family protein [Deltaproteobacteria bacterium]|nr:GldG family protein [Deltaproteobacteria bacterium]MBW1950542.1 GldG family protein [Deltaproteobacteria bacterium]MBW2007563.1 GldG family protein [Deltaproteobacteria bacterium]
MARSMNRDVGKVLVSTTGVAALLVGLILLNVILSHANIRWDATEDRIYSLSEGTKNILHDLVEPVSIKFFYSKSNRNVPSNMKLYARRVREFLAEYEHVSGGKVTVRMYDPKPDSDEEEWAQRYGLRGVPAGGGEKIYCGLVFLAADREEPYDLLDPGRENLLEYDITRIILQLQSTNRKVLGVISTLPVFGEPAPFDPRRSRAPSEPWAFVTELKKTYTVRRIPVTAERIDEDVDLLMVIHPRQLPRKLLYAVDQFVLGGGNAIVFVDPFCLSDRNPGSRSFMSPPASSLPGLFRAWGISMEERKAVADLDQPTRLRSGGKVEVNPMWISARGKVFNGEDVITSRLESMLFPVAGAIRKRADSPHQFEPLVSTGRNAALLDVFKAALGADAVRRDFPAAGDRYHLAVRIHGRFKTAFPGGPPEEKQDKGPAKKRETGKPVRLTEAKRPSTIIVVGDADLLSDRFFLQRSRILGFNVRRIFNDNLNFVANACEILAGGEHLVGLRSRGTFDRPFTTVLALQREARAKWLSKEKELVRKVEETNRKLRELEKEKDAAQRLLLSPEQEAEIARFREEKRRIRRELKEVRKNLRADIERLGARLKAVNIFLMPLLVSLAGAAYALYRRRRMKGA